MITPGLTDSYKLEVLQGIHQAADTYNLALFSPWANLDHTVTTYSAGTTPYELNGTGTGYAVGGQPLTGFSAVLNGTVAQLSFNDAQWANATFVSSGGLIYNSTAGYRSVAVINFNGTSSGTLAPVQQTATVTLQDVVFIS